MYRYHQANSITLSTAVLSVFFLLTAIFARPLAGELDHTFSGDGKLTDHLSRGDDFGSALAVQADGKTVVAGRAGDDIALARFNVDGTLDITFGPGHNGDRTAADRLGDEVFPVEDGAPESAEHASLGHLAMIDREAAHC